MDGGLGEFVEVIWREDVPPILVGFTACVSDHISNGRVGVIKTHLDAIEEAA